MGEMRDQAVVVGGLRLMYRAAGDPAAPPVLLLHALGERSSSWDRVAIELSDTYRVYAPDLRGHGRSDWPGTYSFESMRDDMAGFLDVLAIERAAVVGHSMGAGVAGMLAQHQPGRVAALVLEEPPPLPPLPERAMPARPEGRLSFDWAVVRAITAERNRPDAPWWDRLTAITAPTLVIGGGPSSHLPQTQIERLAAQLPGAQHVVIDGGHNVHSSCPRQFIGAVRRFLQGTQPE
jgi:3-oxoadipate enol-lactonase